MRCTCNLTAMSVCSSTVVVEKCLTITIARLFVRRLWHLTCMTHAPYCDLWAARLYKILSQCLTKGTIFGGKKGVEYKMCSLIFSTNFSETFFILTRFERYKIIM